MDKEYPQEVIDMAYKNLFTGMAGQIVLSDLRQLCHVDKTTFNQSHAISSFLEGQRSVYIYMVDKSTAELEDTKAEPVDNGI